MAPGQAPRISFLIVAAILLAMSAAREVRAGTSLGALGGITRSSFGGDAPSKGQYRPITGFAFGGICEVDLGPNVKLSLQPSLVRKGTRIAYEVKGQEERVDSVDIRIDYITLPVLLKVMTGGGRFYISGGLEIGFPIQAEHETSSAKTNIKEGLTDLDLAADFGIGFHVPLGRPVMFFELRYTQSLRNIIDENWADENLNLEPRVKNSGTQFYVGLLYGL